jgi:hypothetical protein
VRYLVLPERPKGTEGWNEEELAALVTRNAMIGVEKAQVPADNVPSFSAPMAENKGKIGGHDERRT